MKIFTVIYFLVIVLSCFAVMFIGLWLVMTDQVVPGMVCVMSGALCLNLLAADTV